MSTFFVWAVIPAVIGAALFLIRRFYLLSASLGSAFCALMAFLAWRLPIDSEINLGRVTVFIASSISIFGRQFALHDHDRPLLIIIYLLASFWFFAAYWSRAGRMMVPLGIIAISLLIAAFAVQPFLYAGLLIVLAAFACVPILASPGRLAGKGVLRFLISVSLGAPFILFTGWMLAGVETRPGDVELVNRAAALLCLGIVLLMGIFPFHTWVLMLSQEVHPYAAGFVLVVFPWMVSLFGLNFLQQYAWLNAGEIMFVLRWIGVITAAVAGIWAAFERHLGRLFGYAVLIETGLVIAAASLPTGRELVFEMILPRTVSLGVWALALTIVRRQVNDLQFQSVSGLGRSFPVASAALILAQLSVAGVPLLAAFPLRLALWDAMAQTDFPAALSLLAGSVGLVISGLRVLAVLVTGEQENPWKLTEPAEVLTLMSIAIFFLLVSGIFPQFFLPLLLNALQAFPKTF